MATLSTVNVTPQSTLIFGGQGSNATPIQLINRDPANTVYLATTSNPAIGQPGVIPLLPGDSIAFDGSVSVWGITSPLPTAGTAALSIVSSSLSITTDGPPCGYPSIVSGNHRVGSPGYGGGYDSPVQSVTPVLNSSLTPGLVAASFDMTPVAAGAWDCIFDNWYSVSQVPTYLANDGSGLEIEIWINHYGGVGPSGTPASNVVIDGIEWTPYLNAEGPISYVAVTPMTSVANLDFYGFTQDAIARGLMTGAWYFVDVECGFEIWEGGAGLAITNYSCTNGAPVAGNVNGTMVQTGGMGGQQFLTAPIGPYLAQNNEWNSTQAFTVGYSYAQGAPVTAEISVIPGGSNYSPGSLLISGPVTATISGTVTVDGTVDVSSISGDVDINTVAGDVNVNGVGGFIAPGQLGNIYVCPLTTIAAIDTVTMANGYACANYASMVLSISGATNNSVAAGAAVCIIFRIAWFDGSGVFVAEDTVSTILSPSAGPDGSATWEIPVKGSTFTLFAVNVGTTGTITIVAGAVAVDGAYRVIPNIRALNCTLPAAPTLTGATVELQSSPVYNINSWIASIAYTWAGAITNTVFPFPQWCGEVAGYYQDITTALARNATIVDLSYAVQGGVVSGSGYPYGVILNIPGSIDANPVPVTLNLPPSQCALILDSPAAAGSFFLSLVGVGN